MSSGWDHNESKYLTVHYRHERKLERDSRRETSILIKFTDYGNARASGVGRLCREEDKQRNDRDMDIKTHPFPASQLVFIALCHYQLNRRE